MADLVFRSTTRGGRDFFEVTDDGMAYGGKDRYNIKTDESMNYADTVDEVLAELVSDGAWRINYDKIEVDELGIGKEFLEITKLIRSKYNWLYNLPKGSKGRQFYFDIGRYFKQELKKGTDYGKIFDKVDDVIEKNNNFEESKKINRKSIKECKTMKKNRMTEKKNSFDDDFVSKSDWLFGDDRQKLKSILDGMTIDEVQEYLGYWWTLENVDASKGIYTFSRPVWGNIIVHTKKNKVQFVESRKLLNKSVKEGKTMKKNRMTERFNAPKDWDFEDMVNDYGMEYLQENDSDSEPFEMNMLGEIWNDPLEAVTRTFYGGRYGFDRDSFNPNDDYFRVNAYGNGESIPYLDDYLKDIIDEESFYDWCVEQGYFESDEDDE